jgi:K+-transporting ATPase KdpF subunit
MPGSAKNYKTIMENLIAGVIALALFVYLVAAMLRPEKF